MKKLEYIYIKKHMDQYLLKLLTVSSIAKSSAVWAVSCRVAVIKRKILLF